MTTAIVILALLLVLLSPLVRALLILAIGQALAALAFFAKVGFYVALACGAVLMAFGGAL